jgi:phenylacetate-CoA ligase
MGRADQTTKVKGLFVRPEQVAALVARHKHVVKARVIVTRENEMDQLHVQIEAEGGDWTAYPEDVHDLLKLRGTVEVLAPGELPKDGVVIEDRRSYD